jgi:hypothetical protein
MSMSDPVTPVTPAIPVGLGTFIGLGTGAGQWAAAIIAAVNGDHSITTITLIITGAATVITTLIGRYAQAHALIKSAVPATVSLPVTSFAGTPPGSPDLIDETERTLGQTDPDEAQELDDPAQVPKDEGDADATENIS